MKVFLNLQRYLVLFSLFSNVTLAGVQCASADGILAKVSSSTSVGRSGAYHSAKYEQLFFLPNGDRMILNIIDSTRFIDGSEARGPKDRSKFDVEYRKLAVWDGSWDYGTYGPKFFTSDDKPQLGLVKVVGNGSAKKKTFELEVYRNARNISEYMGATDAAATPVAVVAVAASAVSVAPSSVL